MTTYELLAVIWLGCTLMAIVCNYTMFLLVTFSTHLDSQEQQSRGISALSVFVLTIFLWIILTTSVVLIAVTEYLDS